MTEENIIDNNIPTIDSEGRPLKYGQRQLLKRQQGGDNEQTSAPQGGRPDRSKPVRVKFNERNRISFEGQDPNFIYRVVNDDTKGNLQKKRDIGYDFVESDQQIGDFRVAEASKFGKVVCKQVGHGTMAYLMRIPKEYYEEDRKAKDTHISASESALRPKKEKEEYGTGLTNE